MKIFNSPEVFCALVLTTLTITVCSVSGLKRPAGSKCKNISPVDVDDDWAVENEKAGLEFPFGSKGTDDVAFPAEMPKEDKSLKQKKCKKATARVRGETLSFVGSIRYNRLNQFTGLFFADTFPAPPDALKYYLDLTMVLTNNNTFALYYVCIGETNEFWYVASPTGTILAKNEKEEILTHVDKELKLSRNKKDIASKNDDVYLLSIKDCDKKGKGKKGGGIPGLTD